MTEPSGTYFQHIGAMPVSGHRFALTDGQFPIGPASFAENGLVEAGSRGVLVRTGRADGEVQVWFTVQPRPPDEVDLASWDEVVEVSWTAGGGSMTLRDLIGSAASDPFRTVAPAGEYRVRVHATDRDGPVDRESFEVIVWPAPSGPPVVHKRTDRLGHRLRGEPEPPAVGRPEARYDWVESGWHEDGGACITLVSGLSEAEVLDTLGAQIDRAATRANLAADDVYWIVAAGTVGAAVLAIEPAGVNRGFFTLRQLSRRGRAASFFWNVNALTGLGLSRDGADLADFSDWQSYADITDPEAVAALDGLDFADIRHCYARALLAMERFVGVEFSRGDVARIEERDVFYPVTV